jgi:hypothetical protein
LRNLSFIAFELCFIVGQDDNGATCVMPGLAPHIVRRFQHSLRNIRTAIEGFMAQERLKSPLDIVAAASEGQTQTG